LISPEEHPLRTTSPKKTISPRKQKLINNDAKKIESQTSYITLYDKMALNILRQKLNLPDKNEVKLHHDAKKLPSLLENLRPGTPNTKKKSKFN
jgi:hypothetical protein